MKKTMNNYPKKYNKLLKVIESEKFKETFKVAVFKKRLSSKIHKKKLKTYKDIRKITKLYAK